MSTKLKILISEDSAADAELVLHELRRAGYDPEWKRVETEPEYLAQISQGWEIILADYNLPGFSGLRALELLRERDPGFPIIIISGTIGEEKAVATIKVGANDYIMKDRMTRLGPAVERALRDATERRARKQVEKELLKLRKAVDTSSEVIFMTDRDGIITFVNPEFTRLFGYTTAEVVGKATPRILKSGTIAPEVYEIFWKTVLNKQVVKSELFNKTKDGRLLTIESSVNPILDEREEIVGFLAIQHDITARKKVEEKLRETLSDLGNALGGIIQVISAITEKRDPYTAGHQRRVADLALAIGQEMGLSKERVEGLRMAGTIHDIGKVSIPAEILSKPTRLTELEYQLIQSHPQIGHDILSDIEFSWPIAEMVLQHHERINGSGYPRGLKGDDILLEARILAISDVVEAMASHRPYRPALGIAAALEEIEKSKGILYDPEAAATCLKLFREKEFKFET